MGTPPLLVTESRAPLLEYLRKIEMRCDQADMPVSPPKPAAAWLGAGVTVGIGSVKEIGVAAQSGAQTGAFSVVPKHSALVANGVYVGIPARPVDRA